MSMETALRARIKDNPAVAAITTNVEWDERGQGSSYPSVVLQIVSAPRPQHMKGFQGLRRTWVQITVSDTPPAVGGGGNPGKVALRDAIIAAIAPSGVFGGVRFERAFIDTVRDRSANTDTGFVHRDEIDALIWHD